jgi:T5SS/PEP-CTERM-associated repeat protein
MKNKSASQFILTGLFAVLVLAASHSIVRAQECPGTSNWIGGTGGWFTGTNWSNGCVPNVTIDATINNGGHAQIHGPLNNHAAAESLVLGDNEGDSGSLTIDGDDSAVLDVGGPCRGNIYVGNRGSGNLTITDEGYIRSRYGYVGAVANSNQPTSSSVSVKGQGTKWFLYDYYADPGCSGAALFIGCTANSNNGGTATVDVSDGARIEVNSLDGATGVKVGLSGTLTGNGLVYIGGVTKAVEVHGTLAPAGELEIRGNLDLTPNKTANTVFNLTPQAWDKVKVTDGTGGGVAYLGGRITVIMSGNFTAGMSFNLVHADTLRQGTFDSRSYVFLNPLGPCLIPTITYGARDANLVIVSTCAEAEP